MADISPQAIVEKGARIAPDVKVGPFCYIGSQVRIGAGCIIDNNVTIVGRTTVGEKTHVYPMAVVGASPDDGEGECFVGKACAIREQVTVYAGSARPTTIGDDNLIMIASSVGAGATVGDHGIFANCTIIEAAASVEDYVRSSAFAVVEEGRRVGSYTFIAGYVSIDRDAPPYAILQGMPYRVRGVNSENLKRCGFTEDDIRSLREAFRELFDQEARQVRAGVLDGYLHDEGVNACVRHLAQTLAGDKAQ